MQGRQGEPAVGAAVAVVGQGEPAGGAGVAFLAFEGAAFVFLADLGRDHVEDPPAEHAQRLGVVVAGVDDQPCPSGRHGLVVDQVSGQGFKGVEDHGGLVRVQVAGGQGVGHWFVVVEPPGQAHPPVGLGPGQPGVVRPPRRRTGGPFPGPDVDPIGVRGDPELELADAVTAAG